ncbi:MAG: FtsK/SpoIIIE domain-containing protein [Hydrogeniiclostridium mannosilyticum]
MATAEGIHARPMWMPPLEKTIVLDGLLNKYGAAASISGEGLAPVVGEADDPENQRQFPLTLPLSAEGNAVVYGAAGGGKTTFITTLLYGLLRTHSARTLHVYLLDFGSETLRAFVKAPQVGDVLFSYDTEKMQNFFKMLTEELGISGLVPNLAGIWPAITGLQGKVCLIVSRSFNITPVSVKPTRSWSLRWRFCPVKVLNTAFCLSLLR